MRQPIRAFAFTTLLIVGIAIVSPFVAAQVPQQLQPPANEHLLLQVHAKGDQVYTCKGDAAQFTWTLKAPDAQLFDENGKPFANAPSPDANSIPWLLVNIVTHEGTGVLSSATTIQRLNTKGGKAPASGCDASHVGQEVRAPYTADYLFYGPK